jgi:cell division protein FtsB
MREFQAKKRARKILYSKGVIFAMLAITLFMLHATWNLFKKERESAANVVQANKELDKLESRQQVLDTEIKRLSTDEGVEEEIRSKFSVSKEGEHLLVIVDNATSTEQTLVQPKSWWEKLKSIF